MLLGGIADSVDVYWRTDDQAGDSLPFKAGAQASANEPRAETVRLGVKRFNTVKLKFVSDNADFCSRILSLSVVIK